MASFFFISSDVPIGRLVHLPLRVQVIHGLTMGPTNIMFLNNAQLKVSDPILKNGAWAF